MFISSHRSGHLYVWSTEHTGKTTGPQSYAQHAEIQDAVISTVRSKNKSSVLFRWSVGHGPINSFAFSPDLTHIAIASQDGFLRLYDFPKQQFYGRMRSYYGGLLCVCWSPDGRYTVTGGEDDLITVWSFEHRKVVARGEGHKSYVNDVGFDPYTTYIPDKGFSASARHSVCSDGEDVSVAQAPAGCSPTFERSGSANSPYLGRATSESGVERTLVAYRLGSVGQDTQLCLWDLSGDSLKLRRPFSRGRSRTSRQVSRPQSTADLTGSLSLEDKARKDKEEEQVESQNHSLIHESDPHPVETEDVSKSNHVRQPSSSKGPDPNERTEPSHAQSSPNKSVRTSTGSEKEDTKEVSPSTSSAQSSTQSSEKGNEKKDKKLKKPKGGKKVVKIQPQRTLKDPVKRVMRFMGNIGGGGHTYRREAGSGSGTFFETCNSDDIAPKMEDVNLVEPLVAKVISHERLTALVFRRDCIVTACQEGFVQTWARPGTELPAEAAADYSAQTNPPASSIISNPGVSHRDFGFQSRILVVVNFHHTLELASFPDHHPTFRHFHAWESLGTRLHSSVLGDSWV